MDDRHYLSTPRPVLNQEEQQPTWEVDVFRVGVEEPLLTLEINNSTLPPRCNKKKKVVWKLPDTVDQIPSFGTEDKRRIWELFKQQKKVRRKSSKLGKTKQNSSNNNINDSLHSSDSQQDMSREEVMETTPVSPRQNISIGTPEPQSRENGGADYNGSHTPRTSGTTPMSFDNNSIGALQSPPPGFGSSPDTTMSPPMSSPPASAPPGLSSVAMPPQPTDTTMTSPPPPPLSASVDTPPAAAAVPPGISSPSLPTRKTWRVTITSTRESAATSLARMFIDTYYAMLHVGNSTDLLPYYCPGIQKSLSVGDAHHVCTTLQEVLLQLQSLAQPSWQLKGVVTQVGIANSVILLITGTVLLGNEATPMAFCHSVTLVPVQEETHNVREYQIHNDAMAFLN